MGQGGVYPQEIVIWSRLTPLELLIFIGQLYGIKEAEASKLDSRWPDSGKAIEYIAASCLRINGSAAVSGCPNAAAGTESLIIGRG